MVLPTDGRVEAPNTRKRKYEDLDDDEVCGEVEAYDPNREEMPKLSIYLESFRQAEEIVNHIFDPFLRAIERSSCNDKLIEGLAQKIRDARTITNRARVTVGLVGGSGVGKSSLLNNLLGVEEIASVANGGGSCTTVIQGYASASEMQGKDFSALIKLQSLAGCKLMVQNQAKKFIRYARAYLPNGGAVDSDNEDDIEHEEIDQTLNETEGEDPDGKLDAQTAIENLTTLFSEHDEFKNYRAVRAFLLSKSADHESDIMEQLDTMTENLWNKIEHDNGNIVMDADSVSTLMTMIEPFTTRKEMADEDSVFIPEESEPCFWPWVLSVTIHFSHRLLEAGIKLMDLPGTTDTNRLRVETTYQTLRDCSHRIIVCDITRAETDTTVDEHLQGAARVHGINKTILVCTNSDKELNTAPKYLKGEQQLEWARASKEISVISADLKELEKSIRAAKQQQDSDIVVDLTDQKTKAQFVCTLVLLFPKANPIATDFEKKQCENRLQEIAITARNAKVTNRMMAKWKEIPRAKGSLKVFCVSNKHYDTYLSGSFDKIDAPPLSVQGTNIPDLRTHLLKLPAGVKFQRFRGYCHSTVQALLNKVESLCNVNALERKENWDNLINATQKDLLNTLDTLTEELIKNPVTNIVHEMNKKEIYWTKVAKRKCEEGWFVHAKMPAATFRAFIRKYGKHSTAKVKDLNMNDQLLYAVRKDFTVSLDDLCESCSDWTVKFINAARTALDKLKKRFKDDPAGNAECLVEFYNSISIHSAGLQREIEEIGAGLQEDFVNIQNKALHDEGGAYLSTRMAEVYEDCMEITGTKAHDQRKTIFLKALTSKDNVFKSIPSGLHDESTASRTLRTQCVIKSVVDSFNEIRDHLQDVYARVAVDSEEGRQLCDELQALVKPARDTMAGTVHDLLEAAEKEEKSWLGLKDPVKVEPKE
ncbi:hypothetical protein NA57DRAFT_69912 [Rhizodiscina lignyota]|uniref:Nuclear GTPase SLIP-GC n=1 Tax=Rhizodiscina lignyota TaxID=1504668 RepID=A0A9P4IQ69_9PEZI|nr:hypothetical protein NA57DRAFT_69912 [Rhizodiscina lignyota]